MSTDLARELYEAVKRRGELRRAANAAVADREVPDERWMEIAKAREVAHAESVGSKRSSRTPQRRLKRKGATP